MHRILLLNRMDTMAGTLLRKKDRDDNTIIISSSSTYYSRGLASDLYYNISHRSRVQQNNNNRYFIWILFILL